MRGPPALKYSNSNLTVLLTEPKPVIVSSSVKWCAFFGGVYILLHFLFQHEQQNGRCFFLVVAREFYPIFSDNEKYVEQKKA